mgnify:CR=1 FL=1
MTRTSLLNTLQNEEVTLSNAITHSHGKNTVSFPKYLNDIMRPPDLETALTRDARVTWYAFGDNYWPIVYEYPRPEVYGMDHRNGALSFGVGQTGSGVPFHTHGPVMTEVFHGKKRWFMAPFDKQPQFDPNISSFTW